MAYKEVTVEQGEGGGGDFFQFTAIGDKLTGIFAGTSASTSKYAKPGDLRYNVLTREGMKSLDPAPTDAARKLAKGARDGELKPGCLVMMTYTGDRDVGQPTKMKQIKTLIDPEVKPASVEMLKKHAATPPKPKQPEPKADDPFGNDDIPF